MKDVEQQRKQISASEVLKALLSEFSAVPDYRTLRDSLPRYLATVLRCRSVLLYQRTGETLHFAAGSFDDEPGWSTSLLAVAHINPINLSDDGPEASAWRERQVIAVPQEEPTLVAVPLIYRHRGTGVLVALRGEVRGDYVESWEADEVQVLDALAGVVALLLENTRLLERDRERIHELSLLNSISSQMNGLLYERERLRSVVVQRAREISAADLCELIEPSMVKDEISWVTPVLRELLLQRFHEQRSLTPVIIERPGDLNNSHTDDYLRQLPATIKTFFAFPLLNGRAVSRRGGSLLRGSIGTAQNLVQEPDVLGIVVGAYHHVSKLRREEVVLLQVLASQASAVLENMYLMGEVIEARNEARELLRQVLNDQKLKELILESIPSGLITTDSDGCIITFNRAAEAILGYHACEVLGQPLHKVLDVRSVPSLERVLQRMEAGRLVGHDAWSEKISAGEVRSETVLTVDRHGQEVVLDIDLLPLWGEPGKQIGILASFIDVSSVHRLEEEKRRLDRLASLGEMAANVAHEVRNPLASIKTVMQMLGEDLSSNRVVMGKEVCGFHDMHEYGVQESVAVVLKEVERLDKIVRNLLLFARPSQLQRMRCDLVDLSERVLHFMQKQCTDANVVIHRVYSAVPAAWIDGAQMEQVLLNLYMNAIQAMPDGGILTVTCQMITAPGVSSEARKIGTLPAQTMGAANHVRSVASVSAVSERKNKASAQQWLEIVVNDTGVGIPPDQVERIFQPFFTTKAHGIGLGLAITRRLVEDHGGYILVEGHFGYGATVSVRLPLLNEEDNWDDEEHVEAVGG
jgi:PAS domain S-box-containing protein